MDFLDDGELLVRLWCWTTRRSEAVAMGCWGGAEREERREAAAGGENGCSTARGSYSCGVARVWQCYEGDHATRPWRSCFGITVEADEPTAGVHLGGGERREMRATVQLREIPSTRFGCGAAQLTRPMRAHARQVGFDAMASALYGAGRKKATQLLGRLGRLAAGLLH